MPLNELPQIEQAYRDFVREEVKRHDWYLMEQVKRIGPFRPQKHLMTVKEEDGVLPGWWPFTPKRGKVRAWYQRMLEGFSDGLLESTYRAMAARMKFRIEQIRAERRRE